MVGFGGARGATGILGIVLVVVGLVAGLGIISLAVVPVPSAPGPSLTLSIGATSVGLAVNTTVGVTALPVGSMNVSSVSINWGGSSLTYNLTRSHVTGRFTVSRTYTFGAAGTYSISASAVAKYNGAIYIAKTITVSITVPSTVGGGCTVKCVQVSSAFTAQANGLSVAFTDQSTILNASSETYAWSFGDGGTGAGPTVSHTYSAAGSFMVTETVTATNATGSQATGSSSQNITVTANGTGCQGTGTCSPPVLPFLTPTSGLFIGAGIGLLIFAGVWGRPEVGILSLFAASLAGFVVGMLNVGAWVL